MLQATIQAQRAFRNARKAFAEGVRALAEQMGLEIKPSEPALPSEKSGRGTPAAGSSRPASGASSVGSAASASRPRLSIDDSAVAPSAAVQTPQAQIMRGHGRRHTAEAEPVAAPVTESNGAEPAGKDGVGKADAGQEEESCRPLGQQAPLQPQQGKQPAVASVVAHASAGQLLASVYLSAAVLHDSTTDAKEAAVQVSTIPHPTPPDHCK